ncbi:hypothetical protein BDQ17DRAFT_1387956 [Cyathus striatus]|nr:hypothetical protein BDQ17DRAFT_1387956 [Cyathus striatus]
MPDIQLLSDLHLEVERGDEPLYTFDFPACAPNLALLGDIGWTGDDLFFTWLELQLARFKRVFFVSGNHEPYASTLTESEVRLEVFETKAAKTRENDRTQGEFIFLNRKRYDITPNVTLLGCTLWAALNPDDLDILSWALTDFKRIGAFNPEIYQKAHETDIAWLRTSIETIKNEELERKVVIFSHHAPTIDGTGDPKFLDGPTNSAFATELSNNSWWNMPVAVWAFGHTHWCCDFDRKGVRVVSNQRGYSHGSKGFNSSMVISI